MAAVFLRVDRRDSSPDERVRYGQSDLREYSQPNARPCLGRLDDRQALAKAAITNSQNTAANPLLAKADSPPGLTQFFRPVGDPVMRLDRIEPMLNTNVHGDVPDTASPHALVRLHAVGALR